MDQPYTLSCCQCPSKAPTQHSPLPGPLPAPQVVHTGVGPVSHSDVQLAIPLGARILGFNVRSAAGDVEDLAKMHGIEVGSHCGRSCAAGHGCLSAAAVMCCRAWVLERSCGPVPASCGPVPAAGHGCLSAAAWVG